MVSNLHLMLTTPSGTLPPAHAVKLSIAHTSYRIGGGPHLFRATTPVLPQGGLMVIDAHGFDGNGTALPFCQEVIRECDARRFSGVICQFHETELPIGKDIIAQLDSLCKKHELSLYISEEFGAESNWGIVLISSAISGGTLQRRLLDAQARYGTGRIALLVERVCHDFFLPSPTGQGSKLTPAELERRLDELRPSVFFSNELCAHYFTYMSKESGAHFVLYDDAGSIRKKFYLAEQLGIRDVLLPYHEVSDCLDQLLT